MKTKSLHSVVLCCFIFFSGNDITAQTFSKITNSPISLDSEESIGCAWGDFDSDGDEDLFVSNGNGSASSGRANLLFINNGPGENYSFTRLEEGDIVHDVAPSRGASWGDYNNDGYLDLIVANQMGRNYNYVYKNKGDGTFERMTKGSIAYDFEESEDGGWFDYNRDSYLDVFMGNPWVQNGLYRNNGDGTFIRIEDDPLGTDVNTGPQRWCDFDEDGDYDIVIGYWGETEGALFINDGNNHFTKTTEGRVWNDSTDSMYGGNWLDYDNDGDWDLICVGRAIYRNEGKDSGYVFTKLTNNDLIRQTSQNDAISSWADMDNDGDLDAFVSPNMVFTNNGSGLLTRISSGTIHDQGDLGSFITTGSAWADFDNDGDLDLYVCNQADYNNYFFRNDNTNGNSWIKLKLTGIVSNTAAIGTVIKVKANTGNGNSWQMRMIEGQSSLFGQNSLIAHFGLGTATTIDSILILWPEGHTTVLTAVDVNQLLEITESVPAGYLRAGFKADTLIGYEELQVHFTDQTLTDADKSLTSWSWDFDGDGVEDSDQQNPVVNFSADNGEYYSVRLIVSNGSVSDTLVRSQLIRVLPEDGNLALLGKATAMEETDALSAASKAIDEMESTAWKSGNTDDQWLIIELDTVHTIGKVIINWGVAWGVDYTIQTSTDNSNWEIVKHGTCGMGEKDILFFTGVEARYVKWQGFIRNNNSRYQIKEMEIYVSDGNAYEVEQECPDRVENNYDIKTLQVFPNPAGETLNLVNTDEGDPMERIVMFNMAGELAGIIDCGPGTLNTTINISELVSGVYYLSIYTREKICYMKFIKL